MPSIDRGYTTESGDYTKVNDPMSSAKVGMYEIQNAAYPQNNENDHFVRFYINIDDESRLIRENKVQVVGDVDRTDQNRASRGNVSQTRVNVVSGAMGAVAGGAVAGQLSQAGKNPASLINNLKGWKGGFGAAKATAGLAGKYPFVARAVGATAGAGLGVLAANTLNVTKTLKRLGATITLYSPPTMVANYQMNWNETDSDIADLLATDRGGEMVDSLLSSSVKEGMAAKVTKILATNASKDIQLITRTTKNPKKDFLFRDVQQRTFNFHYTFAPRTPKEAEEVARIIYMFKLFSHPELLEGYDNFLYIYPAEWDIVYGFKSAEEDSKTPDDVNRYLNRISSCVLRAISVNYAPGGTFQTLRNGEPTVVTLDLAFAELESLHQGRIEAGF